jgi:bacterioferritin-associated ferredoxin
MILCVCNALREDEVRAAAIGPKACPIETYARLGARPQCGQCLPHAHRLLSEKRAA